MYKLFYKVLCEHFFIYIHYVSCLDTTRLVTDSEIIMWYSFFRRFWRGWYGLSQARPRSATHWWYMSALPAVSLIFYLCALSLSSGIRQTIRTYKSAWDEKDGVQLPSLYRRWLQLHQQTWSVIFCITGLFMKSHNALFRSYIGFGVNNKIQYCVFPVFLYITCHSQSWSSLSNIQQDIWKDSFLFKDLFKNSLILFFILRSGAWY
jgi:hypothetical protein